MRQRALVMLAALAAACGPAGGAEVEETEGDERLRMVNVEVQRVEPAEFTDYLRVVGTVEAERDVVVSAEEGGVVRQVLARKGERVAPGAPLIRIDSEVLRAQLDQAVAEAELAEETWQRQRRLWEEDRAGTEMAYLQARARAETTRAQARVLNERLQRTTVRAPIAGILDERRVEVGTMVSAGSPVARLIDVDTVKIVGGVPERFAADIGRGSRVTVSVDALGGREYTGEVDFVGSAVSGDNRTFRIEVEVPNPGLGIKPGMVANVQIARRTLESALAVPRHAVLRRENGYIVYVARQESGGWRAEARPVTPGPTRGSMVVIEDGLEPGEAIVVVGHQRVAHGDGLVVVNRAELRMEAGGDTAAAQRVEAGGTEAAESER